MEKNLNRRAFLKGAGILAAAGVTGVVVGCTPTSPAISNGSDSAAEPVSAANVSGGSSKAPYPWEATPPAISAADIEETLDCDVLVAGMGVTGCCAVRAAAEEGVKVIYCDKAEAVTSSSNDIAIFAKKADSFMAKWNRVNHYNWQDIVDHEMNECSYFPKRAIWSKWAENNAAVIEDWYMASFPAWKDNVAPDYATGMSVNSSKPGYVVPDAYPPPKNYDPHKDIHPVYMTSARIDQLTFNQESVKIADGLGAKGFFKTALTQCFKDGDRVAGGYLYNYETKKYKKVNAAKGVILCTGDYGSNKDLEAYFLPDVYKNGNPAMYGTVDPEGVLANQGDALWIGDWVGAKIQQHHAPMIHHMGGAGGPGMAGAINPAGFGIAPYLRLNREGYRFMNEDAPGQQFENQVEIQPGQVAYGFCDADWANLVPNFPPRHGSFIEVTTDPEAGASPGMPVSQSNIDKAVESGALVKADTIDDLLAQISAKEGWGIDAALAKAQIKRYQELCAKGKDEDFNKNPDLLTTVSTAPYYAWKFGLASNLCDIGGLSSNERCETYDKDTGKVIPGLYVAGNCQGDRYAVQYPIALSGVASSMCAYYGYIAGKEAAGKDTSAGI